MQLKILFCQINFLLEFLNSIEIELMLSVKALDFAICPNFHVIISSKKIKNIKR